MATVEYGVALTSAPMVHTPGLLRWMIAGYKSGSKKQMVKTLSEGYDLPAHIADDILSGKIPHRVEGDSVVLETLRRCKECGTIHIKS